MSNNLNVFISYAREDGREYADDLYSVLSEKGISAWRDERNINPYQDFSGEIEKAIEASTHVIVCLTPSIAQRKDSFVRREIIYAQGWEKPIIPLLMPGFDRRYTPTLLNYLTWIDFEDFETGLFQLLARLDQKAAFVDSPAGAFDPFHSYLHILYKQIVDFLDTTVFSLVSLHVKSSPKAVNSAPHEIKMRALPVGFVGLPIKSIPITDVAVDRDAPVHFEDFNAAFEYYHGQILLLGEPGAGKTTTLMAYAREAVARRLEDSRLPLPLIAPIASYPNDKNISLAEWLGSIIEPISTEMISSLIERNNALLLLDGLDELGSERFEQSPESTEKLNNIVDMSKSNLSNREGGQRIVEFEDPKGDTKRNTPKVYDPREHLMATLEHALRSNKVVITSRVKDYESIGVKIALQGAVTLQPLDDSQLEAYLDDYPDLWTAIQSDVELRDMARTPLPLSLLTFAYVGMGERTQVLRNLSQSPEELRDQIFRTYVKYRYEREQMRRLIQMEHSLDDIYIILGKITLDLLGSVRNYYPDINEISIQTCQIVLGSSTQSFLELAQRLHLLMPLGENSYRFVHLLLRDHFGFPYISMCLESYDNLTTRYQAVRALGQIGDTRAIALLINLLDDEDIVTQTYIKQALVRLGASCVDLLLNNIPTMEMHKRRNAVWILGEIGDRRAVDALSFMLTENPIDEDLNSDLEEAIGKINGERLPTINLDDRVEDDEQRREGEENVEWYDPVDAEVIPEAGNIEGTIFR